MLFDGDVNTFGDLVQQFGGYYTVDFGEGVTVSLTDVMMMPRSTGQNHANRLNNTVIYGSNVTGRNRKNQIDCHILHCGRNCTVCADYALVAAGFDSNSETILWNPVRIPS